MGIRLQYLLFVVILLSVKVNPANGQQIIFNKVPPPDGKTFEFVTGITQEVDGFMWYSTKRGLYSYDGNKITSNKTNPLNPNSITSNLLESIFADTNGDIWIGSLGQGLDRFAPESGIFTHFNHDPDDIHSLLSNKVSAIFEDNQGILDRNQPVTRLRRTVRAACGSAVSADYTCGIRKTKSLHNISMTQRISTVSVTMMWFRFMKIVKRIYGSGLSGD